MFESDFQERWAPPYGKKSLANPVREPQFSRNNNNNNSKEAYRRLEPLRDSFWVLFFPGCGYIVNGGLKITWLIPYTPQGAIRGSDQTRHFQLLLSSYFESTVAITCYLYCSNGLVAIGPSIFKLTESELIRHFFFDLSRHLTFQHFVQAISLNTGKLVDLCYLWALGLALLCCCFC